MDEDDGLGLVWKSSEYWWICHSISPLEALKPL
jgi:hypothetical protein